MQRCASASATPARGCCRHEGVEAVGRVLAASTFLFVSELACPRGGAAQGAQAPPVFTSGIETVRVDVVVTDARSRPVTGLRREDFVVREDGVPQAIVDFDAVHDPRPLDGASTPQGSTPDLGQRSAAPGTVVLPARFLIVLDEPHLTAEQARTTREFVLELLKTVRASDRVTVLAMPRGRAWSGVGPERPPELERLLEEVGGARRAGVREELISPYEAMRIVRGDRGLERIVERRLDALRGLDSPEGDSSIPGANVIDPRVRMLAHTVYDEAIQHSRGLLEAIGAALARQPPERNRTVLLLASGGFLVDPAMGEYHHLVRQCVRSGVSVYFYDARGLSVGRGLGADTAGRTAGAKGRLPGDYERRRDDEERLQMDAVDGDASGPMRLADETGGFTIRSSDAAGILRLQNDARQYYLIGYTPTNTNRNGELRRITVEVSVGGVSVRARKAYYAPEERAAGAAPGQEGRPGPAPAPPRRDEALARYLALVERHRRTSGDLSRDLPGQWPADTLRRAAMAALEDTGCPVDCRRAAVILHTDAALASLAKGESGAADTQRDIAGEILRRLRGTPEQAEFERLWLLAMGEKELDFGRIPDAVQLFDALVKQHPDDPQARLALGRAHEAGLFILSLVTRANRADRPVLSSAGFDYNREHGPRGVVPSTPAEEAYRRDAIESYREALRFDPELLEARLRLGRLLWLGGKADAALRELAAVAAGSVPESSYLAHLFLSRIEDERGREPAAIAHAEAAVALGPRWQAGQLALADLLQRSGRGGDAAVIIASAVAVPDERASEDAWLLYHLGAYDRAAAAFEALRAMVPP